MRLRNVGRLHGGVLLVGLAVWACAAPRERRPHRGPRPAAAAARSAPRRGAATPPRQPIVLHASKAKVHGKTARYEKSRSRDNIGFWTRAEDWVSWDFDLERPGTFLVQITTACPKGTEGSTYAVAAGGQELVGTVKNTGDWGRFVTEPLGILELTRAGKHTLSVKPVEKRGFAVMNLQAVTLRPGRWEKGLVAWWRFDEGTGTTAEDSVCGTKDVVRFARWARGASRGGLRFNGISSHVVRPAAFAPDLRGGFTLEGWMRLYEPPEGWCPLVNRLDYPTGFFFGLDGAGDLGLHLGVGGKWWTCISSVRLAARRWTHVAATFDPVSGAAVYVDGRRTGRLDVAGELSPAEGVDLLIGKHSRHPWVFHGVIDEVRLYDRPLPASRIAKHHAEGRAQITPPPRLALKAVRPDRTTAKVFERVTLDVALEATYDNPFDAGDVRLDVAAAGPSRQAWTAPGFLYQPFTRRLVKGKEVLEPAGPPRWQIRLSFAEPGAHHLRVTAEDRTGRVISEPLRIEVEPADVPGMVRRHRRYLVTDRGESFFPLGANMCWGGARATFAYDQWLPEYARHGCNTFRVWLSPFWTTFGMNTAASGFDAIDLRSAWRLDHVLATAERMGLRAMLCIDSFNILRSTERSPGNFETAPYVRDQGGPILQPADYFTNRHSRRAYRNRLRYLVARYGYSPSVLAWELWNEVNIIDGYDSATVAAWHAEMARALRRLDPWRHLIATSLSGDKGDPAVESLPELDLAQTHHYGGDDLVALLAKETAAKEAARHRPHFHGELGISGDGKQTAQTDPTGIHLHNALYASVGQGQAGAPLSWWWDSYIHPRKLYPVLGAFARWIEGFDFVAQRASPAKARIVGDVATVEGGVLRVAKGSWNPAPFNRPLTVRIDRQGTMTHEVAPSDLLQGLGFHKTKHNPVTFELDVPKPSTFGVEVAKYSGYGNGHLQILLDRKLALKKDFPVPKGNKKDTLTAGAGLYTIKLPAGKHTVTVRNTGKDWIGLASYRIPWLRVRKKTVDPLRVNGLVGDTMALVWVQNKRHTWANATKKGYRPTPVSGARLQLSGLAPGAWTIEHWDTQKGKVVRMEEATVGRDGSLTIPLPEVPWDAALRLRLAQRPER